MTTIATKEQLLQDAGYGYSLDHDIYLNRKARKVFSFEFVEDHGEAELEARIGEPATMTGEWKFYFNGSSGEFVGQDSRNRCNLRQVASKERCCWCDPL